MIAKQQPNSKRYDIYEIVSYKKKKKNNNKNNK